MEPVSNGEAIIILLLLVLAWIVLRESLVIQARLDVIHAEILKQKPQTKEPLNQKTP